MNYFSDEQHASWQTHYFRGRNGGVLLAFTPAWKEANLPCGIGEKGYEHDKQLFLVVLKDNETGLLHDTKMAVAYDATTLQSKGEASGSVLDAEWNPVDDAMSVQSYFYACHHCECHRKHDARHQAGVDCDDTCEGRRFDIERITPLDQRDLILYSETAKDHELEEALDVYRQTHTTETAR